MFFRDEFWFLSNFYPSPIEFKYDGRTYTMPTAENAFQGAKVLLSKLSVKRAHEILAELEHATPGESKGIGRRLPLDIKAWDAASERMMLTALRGKFPPGSKLAQQLVETGNVEIVEDNDHGDRLWGRVNGVGSNKLGILLMQVRSELNSMQEWGQASPLAS